MSHRLAIWACVVGLLAASCDSGRVDVTPHRDASTTGSLDGAVALGDAEVAPQGDASVVAHGDAALPGLDAAVACANHCTNGVQDCGETGKDCGGDCTACDPCANHCGNAIQDCGETGKDCGGSCVACADPCAGHCGNAVQDCGETGVDCGGDCAACADPCDNHCTNGAYDCGETGVDCGGDCAACAGTDDATIVSQTLPTTMSCDATASARVTVHNSGTTTWFRSGVDGYKLGYVGDNAAPFLPSGGVPRANFPESLTVAPGANVTFDVSLHSPTSPGSYTAEFQMLLETVHWFGAKASQGIAVSCTSAPCSFPQGLPEADFIASATSYSDTDPAVDAVVNSTMATLSGCGIGSSCDLSSFAGATADEKCQSWFAAVTQSLRDQGYCAGQHQVGGTDEIAVSNTGCTGKWYGYHICYYGGPTVVWNPGARRGWWKILPADCP